LIPGIKCVIGYLPVTNLFTKFFTNYLSFFMKKIFLLLITLAVMLPYYGSALESDKNFSAHYTKVNGVGVQYVKINLKNPFLRISIAFYLKKPG